MAALITLAHFSVSAARKAPNSDGVIGIGTVEAANRWLREVHLAEHNARFAVAAERRGSAFVAAPASRWRETLCVREERVVGNDNTVKWNGRTLEVPPSALRPHFARARLNIHEYWDGALSLWLGPHRLAAYGADGVLRQPPGHDDASLRSTRRSSVPRASPRHAAAYRAATSPAI